MNAHDWQRLVLSIAAGIGIFSGGFLLFWAIYGWAFEAEKRTNPWHWRLGWLLLAFIVIALIFAAIGASLSVWRTG